MEPDARRQKIAGGIASTTRNDADFDIQVTDANMSSSDDPSSALNSVASVSWRGEQHDRRECDKSGSGHALKPWNGVAWNICRPKGGDELMDFLDKEDPELVIGSSSCDVSGFLKGSQRALERQTDFHVCARA